MSAETGSVSPGLLLDTKRARMVMMEEDDVPVVVGVTTPDEYTDVTFLVEQKKLYSNRIMLGMASPVLKAMFMEEQFKEHDGSPIPLPGKSFNDFMELLIAIRPGNMKPVTIKNAEALLPLAEEYLLTSMKQECQTKMLHNLKKSTSAHLNMKYLILSQTYNLPEIRNMAIEQVAKCPVQTCERQSYWANFTMENREKVYRSRALRLESTVLAACGGKGWAKCRDHKDTEALYIIKTCKKCLDLLREHLVKAVQ